MIDIDAIAVDPAYVPLLEIAKRIVSDRFDEAAQQRDLQSSTPISKNPNVALFRTTCAKLGLDDLPEEDSRLYTEVIHPLHMRVLEKGR